ncbi:MAG TPA: lytic transglycosylase domain-containing protein [Desulfomonilaceae bacterium]|nr:lytic transglycosylase domain-containing protein [Desulfomonilaceae bacterium]
MVRVVVPVAFLLTAMSVQHRAWAAERVHPNAVSICSVIIQEMSEGKIGSEKAREISLAIANAGNKHFGRVTCGDMWLYMAIAHVESGFRNNIINHQNCRGMFQIHAPSWARKFGIGYADLLKPEINADCGIQVFKYYLELYQKVVPALSAYNSDHPRAAMNYAWAVLGARQKIKKRYTELHKTLRDEKRVAVETDPELTQGDPPPSK